MHKAPEFVQLAFEDMEISPQVEHDQAAVLRGSIQPCTNRVFIDLDDPCRRPDRISFRQCPHRCLKNG
jgi:hypothetical protein